MKLLSHTFKNNTWFVSINHNNHLYEVQIEYNVSVGSNKIYYMGYLKNNKYKNKWIIFGYSSYYNNVKYILKSIKEVIEGNYDNIAGVGFCTHSPNTI